jgi:hypothetical protein
MWICMTVSGPIRLVNPVLWSTPLARVMAIGVTRTSEFHRLRRCRPRPRCTIGAFHGVSSTIARATPPWMVAGSSHQSTPMVLENKPVNTASGTRTSSAWLILRRLAVFDACAFVMVAWLATLRYSFARPRANV